MELTKFKLILKINKNISKSINAKSIPKRTFNKGGI